MSKINKKKSAKKKKKTQLEEEQKKLGTRQTEISKLMEENQALIQKLYESNAGAQDHLDETNEERKEVEDKIKAVATKIYGAKDVDILPEARKLIEGFEKAGYGNLPICVAKTQYSLSDDPKMLGRPEGFTLTVREARLAAGAGYVVILTGKIMTMPGLPKSPAALKIDIDPDGTVHGLF